VSDRKWKSGALVTIASGGRTLRVVGYDSVGSVICEFIDDAEKLLRLYASPSLLNSLPAIAPHD
jgi:hypothetical protein